MKNIKTKDITTGGALLAAMSVCAFSVNIGNVSSISFQTFFVLLIGIVLKPFPAFLTVCAYLLAGFAGLPIFAGFAGGLGIFAGPTWGFLVMFPIGTLIVSLGKQYLGAKLWQVALYCIVASLIFYIGGSISMNKFFVSYQAVWAYMAMYIPFDIVKLVLAVTIGFAFNKRVLKK